MATHSSILAWRIPWTEELGGLQSTGRKESDTTSLSLSLSLLLYSDLPCGTHRDFFFKLGGGRTLNYLNSRHSK